MPRKPSLDPNVLAAALQGLEAQRKRIDEQIAQVQAMLGNRVTRPAMGTAAREAPRKRRKVSAVARRHIIEAQKKRWAEFRKQQTAKAKPKRKPVSKEVMKKRLAALAKARAARAAKRAALVKA